MPRTTDVRIPEARIEAGRVSLERWSRGCVDVSSVVSDAERAIDRIKSVESTGRGTTFSPSWKNASSGVAFVVDRGLRSIPLRPLRVKRCEAPCGDARAAIQGQSAISPPATRTTDPV